MIASSGNCKASDADWHWPEKKTQATEVILTWEKTTMSALEEQLRQAMVMYECDINATVTHPASPPDGDHVLKSWARTQHTCPPLTCGCLRSSASVWSATNNRPPQERPVVDEVGAIRFVWSASKPTIHLGRWDEKSLETQSTVDILLDVAFNDGEKEVDELSDKMCLFFFHGGRAAQPQPREFQGENNNNPVLPLALVQWLNTAQIRSRGAVRWPR